MAINIGDAILKIGADMTGLDKSLSDAQSKTQSAFDKMKKSMLPVGAALTAIGAAGLKMVDSAREMNAALGQTALTMGVSTKQMRDLALATTDVTFPLKSVSDTFELLARAGIRNTDEMKRVAKAFDALGDATGSSAEVVAETLIPAFKVFGLELPQTSEELDKFTWLAKNTTIDLAEFGSVMSYVAMYGADLGLTCDDLIAILAALEARGIGGAEATRLFRTAVKQAADGVAPFNELLGVSQEEIDGFKQQMDDATGITTKYADVANTQYGLMDKIKQKFSELTLVAGSYLTPLEPILAAMTALGPAMIFLSSGMGAATLTTLTHTAALIAHKIAMLASAIAIKAVTAAQWLWNIAVSANPIGLIILAIAALIAIIVLLVKNWDWVTEKATEVWGKLTDFFEAIPTRIGKAFSTLKDIMLAPFRLAISAIEAAINWLIRQINKIHVTVPSWVPGIGGKGFGFNIPEITLPTFAKGGMITEPTLLYGLKSLRPYGIAGERGPEMISPKAGITNNFNISQLIVREEADVSKIARDLFRLQRMTGRQLGGT